MADIKFLTPNGHAEQLDTSGWGILRKMHFLKTEPTNPFGTRESNPDNYHLPTNYIDKSAKGVLEVWKYIEKELLKKEDGVDGPSEYVVPIMTRLAELINFDEKLDREHLIDSLDRFTEAKQLFHNLSHLLVEGEVYGDESLKNDPLKLAKETWRIIDNLAAAGAAEEALDFFEIGYEKLFQAEKKCQDACDAYLEKFMNSKFEGNFKAAYADFVQNTQEGQESLALRQQMTRIEIQVANLYIKLAGAEIAESRALSLGESGFTDDNEMGVGAQQVGNFAMIVLRNKKEVREGNQVFARKGAKAVLLPTVFNVPEQYDALLERFMEQNTRISKDDIEVTIIGGGSKFPERLRNHEGMMDELWDLYKGLRDDINKMKSLSKSGDNYRKSMSQAKRVLAELKAKLQEGSNHGFTGITEAEAMRWSSTLRTCAKQLKMLPRRGDEVNNMEQFAATNEKAANSIFELLNEHSTKLSKTLVTEEDFLKVVGDIQYVFSDMFDFAQRHGLTISNACFAQEGMPDSFVVRENKVGNALEAVKGMAEQQREDMHYLAANFLGRMNASLLWSNIQFHDSHDDDQPCFVHRDNASIIFYTAALPNHHLVAEQVNTEVPNLDYRDAPALIVGAQLVHKALGNFSGNLLDRLQAAAKEITKDARVSATRQNVFFSEKAAVPSRDQLRDWAMSEGVMGINASAPFFVPGKADSEGFKRNKPLRDFCGQKLNGFISAVEKLVDSISMVLSALKKKPSGEQKKSTLKLEFQSHPERLEAVYKQIEDSATRHSLVRDKRTLLGYVEVEREVAESAVKSR